MLDTNVVIGIVGICLILVILIILYISRGKSTKNGFNPKIVGTVSDISLADFQKYITDTNINDVRAIVITTRDVYENKRAQMSRALELYSLIDEKLFPEIYEKIFKKSIGTLATPQDLGGIIVSHYVQTISENVLELYTMLATKVGVPIEITNQQYSEQAINDYYTLLQNTMPDALIILLQGPNMPDIKSNADVTAVLDNISQHYVDDSTVIDAEKFSMYESSLTSWLQNHPSSSSVSRYTKKTKQQLQNISSLNDVISKTSNDVDTSRFQTPNRQSN